MLLLLTLHRRCDVAKLPGFHRPHIPYIFPKQFEQYYPNDTIKYARNLCQPALVMVQYTFNNGPRLHAHT